MIAVRERVSIALMIVSALAFYYMMQDYEPNAIVFPRMMVILMLCLAGVKAVAEIIDSTLRARYAEEDYARYPLDRIVFVLGAMVAYICVLESVGFYTSAFLFFFITTLAIQTFERTLVVVGKRFATCFGFVGFLYLLFSVLLKVQLPKGVLM